MNRLLLFSFSEFVILMFLGSIYQQYFIRKVFISNNFPLIRKYFIKDLSCKSHTCCIHRLAWDSLQAETEVLWISQGSSWQWFLAATDRQERQEINRDRTLEIGGWCKAATSICVCNNSETCRSVCKGSFDYAEDFLIKFGASRLMKISPWFGLIKKID
jgi:hypothetical protein